MLPSVLSGKQWPVLLILILIGSVQSACLLGLVVAAEKLAHQPDLALNGIDVLIAVSAILFLASGRFFERYTAEVLAQKYVNKLRNQVFEQTFSLPATDCDLMHRGGSILRLTSDMAAIRNWIVQGLAPLIVLGIWFIAALFGLFQLHSTLGLSLLASILMLVVGNLLIGRLLYSASEKARLQRSVLIRETSEKLQRFYLIKAFNQSAKERRDFAKRSKRLMKRQISKAKASAMLRGYNEAVLLAALLVMLLVGIHLSNLGILSVESVAVVLTASLYLLTQMRRLSRLYELWTLKRVAEDKLVSFLSRQRDSDFGRVNLPSRELTIKLRKIAVKGRFKRLSAQLNAKSRVQLSGPQGSGKSSLLMALAGLLPLDKGRFVINGRDTANFHPRLWSKTVALVSHELPLLRGDMKSNLFYGARKREDLYSQQVLEVTGLSEYLDTSRAESFQIDDRGRNLSSGLRFRVMLARALLRRPRLLLIEDDSALREASVQRMLENLFEKFDGAIVIAADLQSLSSRFTECWELVGNDRTSELTADKNAENVLPFSQPVRNRRG